MGKKLKILLLSPYLPAGDTTGCARKIYDFIRSSSQRGHAIHLLSFCSQEDKKRAALISPYCSSVYMEYLKDYRRYPDESSCFRRVIEEFSKNKVVDILQCENSYLRRYFPLKIGMPSVLVEHEVLSVSFWGKAGFEPNRIKKFILYARAVKKMCEEKRWYSEFNRIIVFSEADKEAVSLRHKIENIDIIALGINAQEYALAQESVKLYDLLFVGNFSHSPNVDAVLYFYREILPLIRERFPNVSFLIAGANPPLSIMNLSKFDKKITVAGYTENLKDSYAQSKIFVAPVRYGTGMRFKVLEALASGLAVVTTSVGAKGIIPESVVKIADDKYEFSSALIELLADLNKREDLAARGRGAVRDNYHWEKLLDKYENIYYHLL